MPEPKPAFRPKIEVFGRHFHLPPSAWARLLIGILLVIGGLFGFLPILGFWMIPVGLLVLSTDVPLIRRLRRRYVVWRGRRRQAALVRRQLF